MPSTSILHDNLGPAHILIFGFSFGSQLYQSFISGPIAYSTLPRPHFSHLQTRTFPPYFTLQTLTAPLLLLTLPRSHQTPLLTLLTPSTNPSFNTTVLPLLVAFLTSAANLLFVGPITERIMIARRKMLDSLEGEGKEQEEKAAEGAKLKALNSKFSWAHGGSTVLNLVGVLAVGVVGWGMGRRLN